MQYLTTEHNTAPAYVIADGKRYPTAAKIEAGDTAWLARFGIVPHRRLAAGTAAPLGTQWANVKGEMVEAARGTPEEQAAALDAKATTERGAYLAGLECSRLNGKRALIHAGYWEAYTKAVESLRPAMTPEQLVFADDALTWRYFDPVLRVFAEALKISDEEMIALFEYANGLDSAAPGAEGPA